MIKLTRSKLLDPMLSNFSWKKPTKHPITISGKIQVFPEVSQNILMFNLFFQKPKPFVKKDLKL
jgi:hypothetical protein